MVSPGGKKSFKRMPFLSENMLAMIVATGLVCLNNLFFFFFGETSALHLLQEMKEIWVANQWQLIKK
jgi:hypothetical protein